MCLCVSPYFSLSAAPGSLAFVSASIPTYSPSRTRTLAGVDVRAAGGGVVQGSFCVGGGVRAGSLLRFFELMTHAHTEDFFFFFQVGGFCACSAEMSRLVSAQRCSLSSRLFTRKIGDPAAAEWG